MWSCIDSVIRSSVCLCLAALVQFSLSVYNPLGRSVTWPVRLPVNGTVYAVTDAQGKPVDCQVSQSVAPKPLVKGNLQVCHPMTSSFCVFIFVLKVLPVSRATQEVRRSRSFAKNELVFQVRAPPLGYSSYSVSLLQDGPPSSSPQHQAPTSIQNKVHVQKDESESTTLRNEHDKIKTD